MRKGIILFGLLLIATILLFNGFAIADIINVPDDQPTIQAGINAATNGDTVLVQPGTYVENINFNGKCITVASLFLTTGDTTYVSQTIIDGDQNGSVVTFENGEDFTAILTGFTITNGCASLGGGICCFYYSSPSLENVTITGNSAISTYSEGGGIYCSYSSPSLENVTITGNFADYGGGICCDNNSSQSLVNVTITGNSASYDGGGIYCDNSSLSFNAVSRCNIFLNFAARQGNDLYSNETLKVIVDTFTVFRPDNYFAYPINNFTFDILHSKIEQVNHDLYVNPDGSDDNSGLTPDDPLLTISYALAKIIADNENPHTIHLSNGIYSPSQTGEIFPLNCRSYVSLKGDNEEFTILDGENFSGILYCYNDNHLSIEDMTIQNGYAGSGGGIYCSYSSPSLVNLTITDNSAYYDDSGGGGIFCWHSSPSLENVTITKNTATYGGGILCSYYSSPSITDVIISDNIAEDSGGGILIGKCNCIPSLENVIISGNNAYRDGGGMCCYGSSPSLYNVTICDNNASQSGGGIYCYEGSNPSLENVTIYGNTAYNGGGICCQDYSTPSFSDDNRSNIFLNYAGLGNDLYANLCPIINVIVDTFTVIQPDDYFAYPIDNFAFDILHSKIEQFNQDLYVSPTGSNDNSGLIPEDPLLTISWALTKIIADSTNPHTIHLANGTYSLSQTGEIFPLNCRSYVSLQGEDESSTILDGEELRSILCCYSDNYFSIGDMTIQKGSGHSAGGIQCCYSSPSLASVTIIENTGGSSGGIYCLYSNPILINVTLSENTASYGSGGIYCYHSSPSLENVTITDNSADHGGGIGCCQHSNPILNNVTIIGNTADGVYGGGGICCGLYSSPTLTNVTISENTADYGGGIFCYWDSGPSLVNCILWNDTPQEIYFYSQYPYYPNSITISYSDVQGDSAGIVTNNNGTVYWLEGNIDEDPLFADPQNGDFHLTWANFPIPDSTKSPCIDAGDPNSPLDPDSTRADIGAYYFDQSQQGIEDTPIIHTSCLLYQNYPNPFHISTTISFNLATKSHQNTQIKIYNIKGQLVKILAPMTNDKCPMTSIIWDGKDESGKSLSSGIYIYCLKVGDKVIDTKKCLLLK
ncbi:MAG: T9SS type A sorting domain-containing protein [Candidatus Cloacimonetes bacterium]|nr:T9SS type A sorting domain-containing protein [Candidatus Cloacimonadota bacterium]